MSHKNFYRSITDNDGDHMRHPEIGRLSQRWLEYSRQAEDGSSFKGDGKESSWFETEENSVGRKGLQPGRKAVLLRGCSAIKALGRDCTGLWSLHTCALLWGSNLPSLRWSQHSLPFLHYIIMWGVKRQGTWPPCCTDGSCDVGPSLGKEPKRGEILCWTLSMTSQSKTEVNSNILTLHSCRLAPVTSGTACIPDTPPRVWFMGQAPVLTAEFTILGIKEAHGKTRWLYFLRSLIIKPVSRSKEGFWSQPEMGKRQAPKAVQAALQQPSLPL